MEEVFGNTSMLYIPGKEHCSQKALCDTECLEDAEAVTQLYKLQDLQEYQHSSEAVNQHL